jgi:glutamate-5-semialdehyde dehydrogenase
VSRPIYASPRFNLLVAFAVMAGVILVEFLAQLVLSTSFQFAAAASLYDPETSTGAEALMMTIAKVTSCTVVTWVVLHRSRESWNSVGRASLRPIAAGLAFLPIVAGIVIFLSEIDNLLRAFGPEDVTEKINWAPSLDFIFDNNWAGPVLLVILGPLTEEIIFRGLVLRGLLGRYRPWTAIILSAALFSLMHVNPAQVPVTLGLGIVLGWVYYRTRSLGLCFLGHAINNASTYLTDVLPFQVQGFNAPTPEGVTGAVFQPWWFDLIGLALVVTGIALIRRFSPPKETWQLPPVPEPPLLGEQLRVTGDSTKPLGENAGMRDVAPAMSAELAQLVTSLAQRARAASLLLANAPTAKKNAALAALADLIDGSHAALLAANERDLASPEAAALTAASRDRLTLNPARLKHLADSVREVIALPDPVGDVLEETRRPNGLLIRKLRVPIGVIGIIYEARPNVTVDCAILCLKSGNACILRGGKECFHTNTALAALIGEALAKAELPVDAVQLVPTTDRAALVTLLKLDTLIHCIIPRGGENLIRYVAENSTIPVIKHYKGVCFVYADAAADLAMAEAITLNAKAQRPSACNAAEQLLVHRDIAEKFLPSVARALAAKNVELRCDAAAAAILAREPIATTPATEADYTAEFLDYIIAVRVVDSLDTAITTINRDSSNHSDAIVTGEADAAKRFLAEVDSATVYWNASTRFTDGFEFGYGAEIGISTDRLHARGPMGLRELCTHKFVIEGTGQIRG